MNAKSMLDQSDKFPEILFCPRRGKEVRDYLGLSIAIMLMVY